MPLYEYQCESCSHRFEKIQKYSDPPIAVCPSCGGPVKKLFSSPAIQFKGTGWYITDYAKKSGTDSSPNPSASSSSSETSTPATTPATSSTDTKTDSKKD